jgi:hypothetical protein
MKYVFVYHSFFFFFFFPDFEITSKSVGVCVPTHFKETVSCKLSGKVVSKRYV